MLTQSLIKFPRLKGSANRRWSAFALAAVKCTLRRCDGLGEAFHENSARVVGIVKPLLMVKNKWATAIVSAFPSKPAPVATIDSPASRRSTPGVEVSSLSSQHLFRILIARILDRSRKRAGVSSALIHFRYKAGNGNLQAVIVDCNFIPPQQI